MRAEGAPGSIECEWRHDLHAGHAGLKRAAQILVLPASLFGLIAMAGQVIQVDPLTTGGLSFGTPFLGLATLLAGLAVITDGKGMYQRPRMLGFPQFCLVCQRVETARDGGAKCGLR